MFSFPKKLGLAPEDYRPYLCSPEELEASYTRCRSLDISSGLLKPRKILPKSAFAPRLIANSLFVSLADQVIIPDCYAGPHREYIYILCDPDLVALKIFAAPEILTAAERAGVKPGTVFTEESCGTNALALAREHTRLVAIRGEQHFCRLFKDWWCVASPVKDPEGRIYGYLDISMHAEKELGLIAALLQTIVNSIEQELLLLNCYRLKYSNNPVSAPIPFALEREQKLTTREREVLELLLAGLSYEEVAQKLHISPSTVKTLRQNISRKLSDKRLMKLANRLRHL